MSTVPTGSHKHGLNGVLMVTANGCELGSTSKYDVYCRIQLGEEILKTNTSTSTQDRHPYKYRWTQSFALNLSANATNQEFIMFKVVEKGMISDSTQGRADIRVLDLLKLFNQGKLETTIQLLVHDNFKKESGKLHIGLNFRLIDANHVHQVVQKATVEHLAEALEIQPATAQAQNNFSPPPAYSAEAVNIRPTIAAQYQMQPFADVKKGEEFEPMLLLDSTASMNYSTSKDDKTPRKDTVKEAFSLIVEALSARDTQANKEEEGGGLRTITFSGNKAVDIGDLNPKNLKQKWDQIKFQGGTFIVPGWTKLLEVFKEEFGNKPAHERPKLLTLLISDGEAEDTDEFASMLLQKNGVVPLASLYIVIAVLGYGAEHVRALAKYEEIAAKNPPFIRVIPFGAETDPSQISDALLAMIPQ